MNTSPVQRIDKKAFNAAVAREVRGVLAARRVKQADLMEEFGWTRNYVSYRVTGNTPWSPADLIQVCDYLGCDAAQIMGTAKRLAREVAESADPIPPGAFEDYDLAANRAKNVSPDA